MEDELTIIHIKFAAVFAVLRYHRQLADRGRVKVSGPFMLQEEEISLIIDTYIYVTPTLIG